MTEQREQADRDQSWTDLQGLQREDSPARMAFPYPVRVWRVDAADEEAVVRAIKAIDSGARPVVLPPSYAHSWRHADRPGSTHARGWSDFTCLDVQIAASAT